MKSKLDTWMQASGMFKLLAPGGWTIHTEHLNETAGKVLLYGIHLPGDVRVSRCFSCLRDSMLQLDSHAGVQQMRYHTLRSAVHSSGI